MSKYTMYLSDVCDLFTREEVEKWFSSYDLSDYLTPIQIEVLEKNNVWSKEKLARKIVDHYYRREIGFETPALFRHYAKTTMNEIMEKYLLMIYTKFLEYDPLSSVDYVETYRREINGTQDANGIVNSTETNTSNGENSGSSNSTSESSSDGISINSDTPQTNIAKSDILSGRYASSTNGNENSSNINDETNTSSNFETNTQINQNSTNENHGTSKTVETYTHEMKGDNGVIVTNQYLIREFRELAISFDLEIINELNILFMGLF